MNRAHLFRTFILLAILLTFGCAKATHDAGLLEKISALTGALGENDYELIASFAVEHRATALIDSEVDEILDREMRRFKGNAVIHVHIQEIQSVSEAASGQAEARTVLISGDVVRVDEQAMRRARRCRVRVCKLPGCEHPRSEGQRCLAVWKAGLGASG